MITACCVKGLVGPPGPDGRNGFNGGEGGTGTTGPPGPSGPTGQRVSVSCSLDYVALYNVQCIIYVC